MYPTLLPDAIGLRVKLPEALDLAAKHGFEGCTIDIREATDLGVAEVADLAAERGVRLAAWGFPVDFRSDEASYAERNGSAAGASYNGRQAGRAPDFHLDRTLLRRTHLPPELRPPREPA